MLLVYRFYIMLLLVGAYTCIANQNLFEDSLCGCEDFLPEGGYSCQEQKEFGKCGAEWMLLGNFCYQTCERCFCVGECICIDLPADGNYTCQEQKEFGQCDADWMIQDGYCSFTCGRCPCLLETSGACMQYTLNSIPQASEMLKIITDSRILADILDVVANSKATYLIPSNRAWSNFRNLIPNSKTLFENELLLSEFIQYHIILGALYSSEDLQEEEILRSSHLDEILMIDQDLNLNTNLNSTIVVDNNGREAKILNSNIEACGSIIHIVDNVLIPSQSSLPFKCMQFALGISEDTMYMLDLIMTYRQLRQLFQSISTSPHTYFIPSAAAWQNFKSNLDMPELLFNEEELLVEFVKLHITKNFGNLHELGYSVTTLHLGEKLIVNSLEETVLGPSGETARILSRDTQMCGSVINIIDDVLQPTKTQLPYECILQTLGANSQTSSLIQITQNSEILTNFWENVTTEPHAYFLPSRNAWISLLTGMENKAALLGQDELMEQILSYHVTEEAQSINDLIQQGNATTMHLDESLIISSGDGPEAVILDESGRQATLIKEDIKVCNSTLNIIENILVPSLTTTPFECLTFAFQTIPGIKQFSKLISESARVQQLIRAMAASPHTFLIPSSTAIEEFIDMAKNGKDVFNDPEVFETLFLFHVVQNSMDTRQLYEAGDISTMLFEEPIEFEYISNFEISKRQPMDRTSAIIMPNIKICNTTMHIIDHVLLPAITTVQALFDDDLGGFYRGLVVIPDQAVITFGSLKEGLLGEEEEEEIDELQLLAPLSEENSLESLL